MSYKSPVDASYTGRTCLSDCSHLEFVRMQKLKLTNTSVPRYHCSYYDQELIHVMTLGPDRCIQCLNLDEGVQGHS